MFIACVNRKSYYIAHSGDSLGLYRENAIAIESEANDSFGGNGRIPLVKFRPTILASVHPRTVKMLLTERLKQASRMENAVHVRTGNIIYVGRNLWICDIHGSACAIYHSMDP